MRAWPRGCHFMFVSLSAALVQAWGFGKSEESRRVLWWSGRMEMDVEGRQDKEEEEWTVSLKSHKQNWGKEFMPKEGSLYNFKVKSIEIYYNRSLTTTITQTSLFYFHITIWFFYAHEKGFCNTVIYIFYPVISCTPALLPSVLFQIISALTSLFWGQFTLVPLSCHSLLLCLRPGFSHCYPNRTPTKKLVTDVIHYFSECPIIRTALLCDWSFQMERDSVTTVGPKKEHIASFKVT